MPEYYADIDRLRAVAILLAVLFHFDILSAGKAGFISVAVFFIISEFLIPGIIAHDLKTGNFRVSHFLYRRIQRLYPAMMITLVLYLVAVYFVFLPDKFHELSIETLVCQLYVVNIYF